MADKKHEQVSSQWIIAVAAIVAVMAVVAVLLWKPGENKGVSNFQTCKDAGGTILESYPEQCMIDGKSFTNTAQSVDSKSDGYVGLTEQAALDKAASENKSARVVERDGESLPVTMDYMPGRLNLSVKDGKVDKLQIEGEEK